MPRNDFSKYNGRSGNVKIPSRTKYINNCNKNILNNLYINPNTKTKNGL